MLTGRRAFPGENASDVLAAVLRDEPDWAALPADAPRGVRRLLRRCLRKDPRDRLQDAGDARIELTEAAMEEPPLPPPAPRRLSRASLVAAGLAAATLLCPCGVDGPRRGWQGPSGRDAHEPRPSRRPPTGRRVPVAFRLRPRRQGTRHRGAGGREHGRLRARALRPRAAAHRRHRPEGRSPRSRPMVARWPSSPTAS